MSENPSKRLRLTGSFSPASPPYHLAKAPDQTKTVVHPNTPTSPPYMSSVSQANGGPPATAPAPSEMTPPSSVHMSQTVSQQPGQAVSSLHAFTPTSTVGVMNSMNQDSDGDLMMIDDDGNDARSGSANRRSNHDRSGRGLLVGKEAVFGKTGAHGDALLKLCQNPHPRSRPHPSQNLIELYGLNSLASSVARTDANGEKINKIRKSYEGHIKALQIAGRPKAVKMEGAFMSYMMVPDEDYQNARVTGKDLMNGLPPDLLGSLDQALSMAPGPLPAAETQHFRAYLATDDSAKAKPGAELPAKKAPQPGVIARTSAAPSPAMKPSRPERQGAKRRYNDSSFMGYSEGFVDDEGASTAGEDDRNGSRKKRKKEITTGSPFGLERTGHPVGMVGARR